MKIGVLGTGFGAYHARLYKKMDDIESITVFGRNEEKLKALQTELNIHVTTNIEDILNDQEITLVDICLPSLLHKEYILKALQKGKNVFCETPLALSIEDTREILKVMKTSKKLVFVNQFIKHEPINVYLYELIENKKYGNLKALHIRRKTPPLWGNLDFTNISTNLMIHELDFVTWCLGKPKKLEVIGIPNNKEGQCHVDVILNYQDAFVEIQASSMMPKYHPFTVSFEAMFEEATLEFYEDGYYDRVEKEIILYTNTDRTKIELPEVNCYEEAMKDVINSCKNNSSSRLDVTYGVHSLELALQIKEKLLLL